MEKTEIFMNTPIHLGLLILELSKRLMNEFWHDHVKPKCGAKEKLCYMDRDSIIAQIKTDDIHKDTAEDVEARFDTLNYEVH